MNKQQQREQCVHDYFSAWLHKDASVWRKSFADDAAYSECHGPCYRGVEMLERWFRDWNERQTVTIWRIKQFLHDGLRCAVEWHFACRNNSGESAAFDGVSLIEFTADGKIVSIKEFQAKAELHCPYE